MRHALAFRAPLHVEGLFGFLADRAVTGVEWRDGCTYRRAVRLPAGDGILVAHVPAPPPVAGPAALTVELLVAQADDAAAGAALARRLFDLDTDPEAVDAVLGADDVLRPLVERRPGVRVPGCADPHELVVRAIIGQQVSVAGARTIAARLAAELGEPLSVPDPAGVVHRHFPTAATLAELDPAELPMPRARGRSLIGACAALAAGALELGPGADPVAARVALLSLAGIGPWTADYIVLRCLADRDVFLETDLGIRKAAGRLGLPTGARELARRAERWRPYRSHALLHLWLSLADPPA